MQVFEKTQYGEDRISAEFFAALAAELGATDIEISPHGHASMTIGELSLGFRQGYGAKLHRMTAQAYAADRSATQRAYRAGRPISFPESTLDPTRPLEAIKRDIQRRLIDKSAPALRSIQELDAKARDHSAALEANAAELRKLFPVLAITVKEHEADVYGRGVSARMSRDGGLYMQSLSLSPAKARAVLAILLAPES